MSCHVTAYRQGFPWGRTAITRVDEDVDGTGIAFSVLRLREGEEHSIESARELACLHLDGSVTATVGDVAYHNTRRSLFDEAPFAVHVPRGVAVTLEAKTDVEVALFETDNDKDFPSRVFTSEDTANEPRGQGLVDGASLRWVRTIFDGSNSDPNAQLVLGEVVNFPGRWSSYPPHHHQQPEIYHYRFTDPRGYGHAELGEDIFKVRQYDTMKILDERDHVQCAAPGYGMYYIWVIRHLQGARYTVPEFTKEHAWTMQPGATCWQPATGG